jgi:hypothetical protein
MIVVPVETTEEICHHHQLKTAMPGRIWAIASLVCGALSLAFALVVFGPLGVATDGVVVAKGVSNKLDWRLSPI